MKKPYQIESQRAVNQFAEMAADGNLSVQMVLPLAEMMGWLRKGVGELVRQPGLQLYHNSRLGVLSAIRHPPTAPLPLYCRYLHSRARVLPYL